MRTFVANTEKKPNQKKKNERKNSRVNEICVQCFVDQVSCVEIESITTPYAASVAKLNWK